MKLIKKDEGEIYEAKHHSGCCAMRKLVPEKDTRRLTIAVGTFLPQGGAEMTSSPLERVYYAISGTIVIRGKNEEYVVEPGDMIYIAPGEEREFQVLGTEPAVNLVIMTKVD